MSDRVSPPPGVEAQYSSRFVLASSVFKMRMVVDGTAHGRFGSDNQKLRPMNYLWFDWLFLRIALTGKAIANSGLGISLMIRQLFRSRSNQGFQARSSERDRNTDQEAIKSIAVALDTALQKADAERSGLKRRIDDVISRAAIVGGNDMDDYLTRTDDRSKMLSDSDAEIRRGQDRLNVLDQNISHFKFLRTALQTRFPDSKI
jgi:hypothetical protein